MSIESAKALYTRLLVDEELRINLEQAASQRERHTILQNAGFEYSLEDLKLAKISILQSQNLNNDLTEAQAEQIVAGRLDNVRYADSICSFFDNLDIFLI